MQYEYKTEKVISVGDPVLGKKETTNIIINDINRTLKELEEINKNRFEELNKSLTRLEKLIKGTDI